MPATPYKPINNAAKNQCKALISGRLADFTAEQSYFDYTCIQYSGFGDNKNLCWSDELQDFFDIARDKLPRIVSPFKVAGYITKKATMQMGLCAKTPLVACGGGSKSEPVVSIKADVLAVKATALQTADTALLGSAVIAGIGCGLIEDYHSSALYMYSRPPKWRRPGHVLGYDNTIVNVLADFLHAVEHNASITPNFHDGVNILNFLKAAKQSAKDRCIVDI